MKDFFICSFDDYHEIANRFKTYKNLELGCFPENEYGYCRYFALFYKTKKPSITNIMKLLKRKINFDNITHYRTGSNISVTKSQIKEEVEEALNNKI